MGAYQLPAVIYACEVKGIVVEGSCPSTTFLQLLIKEGNTTRRMDFGVGLHKVRGNKDIVMSKLVKAVKDRTNQLHS